MRIYQAFALKVPEEEKAAFFQRNPSSWWKDIRSEAAKKGYEIFLGSSSTNGFPLKILVGTLAENYGHFRKLEEFFQITRIPFVKEGDQFQDDGHD